MQQQMQQHQRLQHLQQQQQARQALMASQVAYQNMNMPIGIPTMGAMNSTQAAQYAALRSRLPVALPPHLQHAHFAQQQQGQNNMNVSQTLAF